MAPRPALAREEVKGGYAMGDRTWNHPDMAALPAVRQAAELDQMSAGQRSIAGTVPCALPAALWRLRPRHAEAGAAAADGRVAVVGRHPGLDGGRLGLRLLGTPHHPAGRAEGGALRHPIVLMHNQPVRNPATVSALPAIIQFFRSHGYRFVAL
jgi:peptidoglycan/xylan/chitin deacetylase (PgdA/CDA1 family)